MAKGAWLIPCIGIGRILWFDSSDSRLMFCCPLKMRNASGIMHVLLLLLSSNPIGHAQTGRYGEAVIKHRWLHPPLLEEHGFVSEKIYIHV